MTERTEREELAKALAQRYWIFKNQAKATESALPWVYRDIKELVQPYLDQQIKEAADRGARTAAIIYNTALKQWHRQFDKEGNPTDDDSKVTEILYTISRTRLEEVNKQFIFSKES